jgi:hypothetical protein
MSWRPPEVATASRPPARLDAVLRAGMAKTTEDDESGLTRSLKNTSLVPTGACLPRGFDPNYCDMDPFYFAGVAIVSSVVGLLINSTYTNDFVYDMQSLRRQLNALCYVPPSTSSVLWDIFFNWKMPTSADSMFHHVYGNTYKEEKKEARAKFSKVCVALDVALHSHEEVRYANAWIADRYYDSPLARLASHLQQLIFLPALPLLHPGLFGSVPVDEFMKMPSFWASFAASTTALVASLKYIKDHLQAHARMIASYFRVNAMRLRSGEEFVLDVNTFARMCREDIIDTQAYDDYDPERAAAEQRLADALRQRLKERDQRAESRDPLMEGLDYPETYASASGAAPLRE